MTVDPCGCPRHAGRTVTDPARHAVWHALVLEQTGITGEVRTETLRAARGFKTGTLDGETILDQRARDSGKRASGALRRVCS